MDYLESKFTSQASSLQTRFQARWRTCIHDFHCLALPVYLPAHQSNPASRVPASSLQHSIQTLHWSALGCVIVAAISCIAWSVLPLARKPLSLLLLRRIFSKWHGPAGGEFWDPPSHGKREAGSLRESFFSVGMVAPWWWSSPCTHASRNPISCGWKNPHSKCSAFGRLHALHGLCYPRVAVLPSGTRRAFRPPSCQGTKLVLLHLSGTAHPVVATG